MGVEIGDILTKEEIALDSLKSKVVAVDGHNALYQFLSIIRGPDGRPLTDSKGRITSHLSGLFYRICKLLSTDISPIYVLDGEPPRFKKQEIAERKERKRQAERRYDLALRAGDLEEARKQAQATSRIDDFILSSTKRLLDLMGVPCVQAPSEGEAQAAHFAKQNLAFAAASQDYDSMLFGSPRVVRNLSVSGRRKLPGRRTYVEVKPELVDLGRSTENLGISKLDLVKVAILVGTDYCDGVKGIGAKKALSLVKSGARLEDIYAENGVQVPENLDRILDFFMNPPVADVKSLDLKPLDREGVLSLLVNEHSFSEDRVARALDAVLQRMERKRSGLSRFIEG